jgi:ketosteroid isomerase-like protein
VDPTSLEFWEWFYEVANEGAGWRPEERQRAIEERWHPDLVLIQSPEVPGTAGEFHGYEGLAAVNRELLESWEQIDWRPREVHELGEGRYLVLLETSGRARRSGILLEGGQIGHILTVRDGKAERMEVYMTWQGAREAAGLG